MKIFRIITALVMSFIFLLTGCATTGGPNGKPMWSSPEQCIAAHTAGGAFIGGVAGAAEGYFTKKKGERNKQRIAKHAVIGAAAGSLIAFAYAWGACFAAYTKITSEQTKGVGETQAEIGYKPQQGGITKIRDYVIDPAIIAPGDTPKLFASYYIMTPDDKEITVTETLTLRVFNPEKKIIEDVGSTSETIVATPGQRKATSEIPIPKNAAEGEFYIVFKITAQEFTDQKEMPITITKDPKVLAMSKRGYKSTQLNSERKKSPLTIASGSKVLNGQKSAKITDTKGGKQVVIISKRSNLWENPDINSKIIMRVTKNKRFPLLNRVSIENMQWFQIMLSKGKTAWVPASSSRVVE